MDKMIDGKKVQNWHRGLRENESRAAFLRRHEISDQIVLDEYRACLMESNNSHRENEFDEDDWYIHNEWPCSGCIMCHAENRYEHETYKEEIWLRRLSRDVYSGQLSQCKPLIPKTISPYESITSGKSVGIEQKLFDHLSLMKCENAKLSELQEAFCYARFPLGTISRRLIDKCDPQAQLLLLIFQPFWSRSLESYDGKFVGHHELFNHVFDQRFNGRNPFFGFGNGPGYDYADARESRIKWLVWGVVLSYQGNLARAGKIFGWRVHSKLQYHVERLLSGALDPVLGQGTSDWYRSSPEQLVRFAEVLRQGGEVCEYFRINSFDPTERTISDSNYIHWTQTLQWLITHRDLLSDEDCTVLVQWGDHRFTESLAAENHFSWKGRTPRAALRAAREYQRQITQNGRTIRMLRWNAHGLSWIWSDQNNTRWEFTELTRTQELIEEGNELKHCVGGYSEGCTLGSYAIVSMRRDGVRVITIQLDLTTTRVIQAHGSRNRPASREEWRAISAWLELWAKR